MKKQELYRQFIEYFQASMPDAHTELEYTDTFQLLVAVILSAQCTDKRVNMVTPTLFKFIPNSKVMANATFEEVYDLIKSISYPNSKAKHLIGMAQMLEKDFGGEVPSDLDDLVKLPGVGRKTANVVMSVAYGKSTMAVDTHVFRVSHRIGLVPARCTTPYSVEIELTKNIPADIIPLAHHWLILHGRYICKSINPQCDKCGLNNFCKKVGVKTK